MEMVIVWGAGLALAGWIAICGLRRSGNVRGTVLASTLAMASLAVNVNVPREASSLALGFMTLYLLFGFVAPRQNLRRHKIRTFVFLWFGLFLVTTSVFNPEGVNPLLQFSFLAFATVVVASKMGAEDREALLLGLVLLGAFHSLLSIWEYVGHEPWLWGYGRTVDGTDVILANPFFGGAVPRAQSTMGHPIAAATLVAVSLVTLMLRRRNYRPVFVAGLLFLLIAGILLTGTRSVVVAIGLALAYYYLVSSESKNKILRYLTTAVIVGAFFIVDLGVSALVDDLVDSGSYTNRAGALESVPALFTRNLDEVIWGAGFGSESRLFGEGFFQQNGFNIVDNQLVTTLATAGIVGLIGLCSIYIYSFSMAGTYIRVVLIFMTSMMFSFDYLRWHVMVVLLFVMMGMSSSMRPRNSAKTGGDDLHIAAKRLQRGKLRPIRGTDRSTRDVATAKGSHL
jgi:hypothetical protein